METKKSNRASMSQAKGNSITHSHPYTEEEQAFLDSFDMIKAISYIRDYAKSTVKKTKPFVKLSKKADGKNYKQQKELLDEFAKKELLFLWKRDFFDKIFKEKDKPKIDNATLNYVLGFFIIAHSEELAKQKAGLYLTTCQNFLLETRSSQFNTAS